jgi:hypothetical protein
MTDQIRAAMVVHKAALSARLGREAQWEQLAAQRWGSALSDPPYVTALAPENGEGHANVG